MKIFSLESFPLYGSSWKYDWKPLVEKTANFLGETCLGVEVKSPIPSQWNIAVLSIADLMQLAIQK